MDSRQNILITGAHRSGSTWLGRVIEQSTEVKYVHEPFNIGRRTSTPLEFWNQYIDEEFASSEQDKICQYLNSFSKFELKAFLKSCLNHHDAGKISGHFGNKRLLIKDPIAVQSAKWISEKLNAQVIFCVRHPAAFVASLKVANWNFDFTHINSQPELISKYLSTYKEEIELFSQTNKSIIEQGVLLWNVIYSIVETLKKEQNPIWKIVRHEDLSLNPMEEIESLFKFLNLNFTNRIREFISSSTNSSSNSKIARKSSENILSWKNRLSQDEISYIKNKTGHISQFFYSENEW